MLLSDFRSIGNKLLSVRKRLGQTQAEVAEAAGLSDRTYADIERGSVNMRLETILRICNALQITPDQILTEEHPSLTAKKEDLMSKLDSCTQKEQETALAILSAYLQSLN